ncbi:MAG: chromosome segregation protein SMC [Nitrosomonas sp.]|nr:chromosome segregation protein SMC [Nitrosomonas sp.]
MRLTKIKLAGFKSFVEPSIIPVTSGLVGIVGPNGCGKSNIIDAVRWVLGESKASALRGDSLQDVIFGGSSARKPIGRASVELIFDNSLGTASGQWSSYAEIAIKRVIQREGASNYYINNIHVRRRDIADLFLGTGIGGRGYAIIEQGMISRIIEAKPLELKMFLEEAAGISKYRERRHETELRLNDTRKNLVRLEDIANELRKQIEHLEIQADVAQQYNSLSKQLQNTQHILWLQQRNSATKQRLTIESEIKDIETSLTSQTEQLHQNRLKRENLRIQEQELNEKLHDTQGKLYGTTAEKTRIEQEIIQVHKNKTRLTQQIEALEKQHTTNQQQKQLTLNHLSHWQEEKENTQVAHEAGQHNYRIESEKLPELEAIFQQNQEKFENRQQDLIQTEQSINLKLTHIQHARKTTQQLESRINRLEQEENTITDSDSNQLTTIQTQITQIETQLSAAKENIAALESEMVEVTRKKETATDQTNVSKQKIANLQAQFNALQLLQQKIENNDALKQWLHKLNLDEAQRVWHHIQIEAAWENALESVLQERLNSLVFSRLEVIHDWQDNLPPGKLSIVEFEQADAQLKIVNKKKTVQKKSATKPEWIPLSSYLTCNDKSLLSILKHWLDKIYVIESTTIGLQQRHLLTPDEKLVTREGHLITPHSVFFHSPDSHLHGVLSRQRDLDQIHSEITALEKKHIEQQKTLAAIITQHEELTQTIQNWRQQLNQFTQQLHTLQLEHAKRLQITKQIAQRKKQIIAELNEIRPQLAAETQHIANTQKEISKLHAQCDHDTKQLQDAKSNKDAAFQTLNDQRQKIQELLKSNQEAAFNEKICQNKLNDLEQTLVLIDEEANRLLQLQTTLHTEVDSLDDTQLNHQLETCALHCKELETTVTEQRKHLDETRHLIQEIEEFAMSAEQKQVQLRDSITQLQLKEQALSISEERLNEQLSETHANEESLLPFINHKPNTVLQTEIVRLQKKIEKLGSVNLAALDELETACLRENKLNTQIQDLQEAIEILQNAINQIDQETKKRLKKTFDAVNRNLQELFPIIFSGGKASLVLSDDKILSAGVMLTAQPPGKKNNSIHLLSGGEKALTALALIFSLFRLNPAPFCMLDEVDAPLDDNNTGRFCELVKNLSRQTQFLFISHNKITMEMAQQLIGITMQEKGVSRVVAVDIAEMLDSEKTKDVVLS